jgi:hypothetical protein
MQVNAGFGMADLDVDGDGNVGEVLEELADGRDRRLVTDENEFGCIGVDRIPATGSRYCDFIAGAC